MRSFVSRFDWDKEPDIGKDAETHQEPAKKEKKTKKSKSKRKDRVSGRR